MSVGRSAVLGLAPIVLVVALFSVVDVGCHN
jgi:hypothetical protein